MNKIDNKQRIKILYCESNIDGTVGGSYYSLFYLVEGLNKNRYDPIVVFYKDNSLIQTFRKAGIKTEIFDHPLPVRLSVPGIQNVRILKIFLGLVQSTINFTRFFVLKTIKYAIYLKRNNIDIVHMNNSIVRSHNWMFAARLAGAKCISHERLLNKRFSYFERYFINRLDAIVCISNAVRKNLELQNIRSVTLHTILNGLDPSCVKVGLSKEEIKSKYKIEASVPLIGIVGNIKEWKGQEIVVKATAEVKKRFPYIKCLIVGDTAETDSYYLERIRKVIDKLGIQENIIFTGYQTNVPDYVNAMDIVIHASTAGEPFGRVLLEAMALQKPLIGARGGAVPEIVAEPVTGLMFEPGDHLNLARTVQRMLEDPKKCSAMGRAGYLRLINKFSIIKNIEQTQQLYEAILANRDDVLVYKQFLSAYQMKKGSSRNPAGQKHP